MSVLRRYVIPTIPYHKWYPSGCPLSLLILNLAMEPLAEHIRTNTKISGINIGTIAHKISLFEDDVILILTNPTSSLAEAQKTLEWFGRISYYKLNTTKSHILDIKLDATTINLLQTQYPFRWPDYSISYWGIQLTRSTKHLFSTNFKPLLHKLRLSSQNITKHY